MVGVMKIDNEVKDKVRKYNMLGEFEQSYRILFKLYNSIQTEIFDRCFVLYNLSLTAKKLNRIDESKMYIAEAKNFMNDKDGYSTEKGCILWLYAELYRNELKDSELMNIYKNLKEYYSYLDENDEIIIGINSSMNVIQDNYVESEKLFYKCLDMGYIESANNILDDIKNRNIDEYNKVIQRYELKNKLA